MREFEEELRKEKLENIQYIDVKGRNGEVTLHTLMPKDSVKLLVGKPSSINLTTIGTDNLESWE